MYINRVDTNIQMFMFYLSSGSVITSYIIEYHITNIFFYCTLLYIFNITLYCTIEKNIPTKLTDKELIKLKYIYTIIIEFSSDDFLIKSCYSDINFRQTASSISIYGRARGFACA